MLVLTLVFVAIAVLVVLAVGWRFWRKRRLERRALHQHGYGPPIVIFPPPSSTPIAPAPLPRRGAGRPAERHQAVQQDRRVGDADASDDAAGDVVERARRTEWREADTAATELAEDRRRPHEDRPIRRRAREVARLPREAPDVPEVGVGTGADVDGALALAASQERAAEVHVLAPAGGTLQMLPGRLVIVEGEEAGREIRFVRLGANPQRVTLGRSPGRPYEHVQLRAATVSRMHARLQYDDGRWHVENLSRTNPLVLNGRAVAPGAPPHPLAEGDVLELGEVICRFHER